MKYGKLVLFAFLAFSGLLPGPAVQAASITKVLAPDLVRPNDGVAYPFHILVSGVYGAFEINQGIVTRSAAEYWDDDGVGDDPIHKLANPFALNIPVPPAAAKPGTAWAPITLTFKVGCDKNGAVFGPAGNTGESPMDDGYFYFPAVGNSTWGYNTVTCQSPPGEGEDPLPDPSEEPPPPWNPEEEDFEELKKVPEPATWSLALLGLLAILVSRRRTRGQSARRPGRPRGRY